MPEVSEILEGLTTEVKAIADAQKQSLEAFGNRLGALEVATKAPSILDTKAAASVKPSREWQTSDGKDVYVLSKSQALRDVPVAGAGDVNPADLSFGRLVKAYVTGNWKHAPLEQKAISTSTGTGGLLVPETIGSQVIDLARGQSALVAAGAQTLVMDGPEVRLIRVATDPTFTATAEGGAITESDVVFDYVSLVAHKWGTLIYINREWVEDAINGPDLITRTVAAAWAAAWDELALTGNGGSDGVEGLCTMAGTQSLGAAITTYDTVLDAVEDLRLVNAEPRTLMILPGTATTLSKLRDQVTGSYLAPPADVAGIQKIVTNALPSGTSLIGDFSKVLLGIRRNIEIQLDTSVRFANDQIALRATFRGDVNVERANHLEVCVAG